MREQERIFLGGVMGSGKTYSCLSIAKAMPKSRFFWIDPDDGVRRSWYKEFPDVKNIEYYFTPRWYTKSVSDLSVAPIQGQPKGCKCFTGGIADAWDDIKKKKPIADDFIIIEMMKNIWQLTSSGFIGAVFEEGTSKWFIEARKSIGKSGRPLQDGLKDWPVINKMHNDDFINDICYNNPSHVILTTSVATAPDREDPETREFYKDAPIRFEGQKDNPYRMHTMLWMQQTGKVTGDVDNRKYYMSTVVKDRARQWIDSVELFDFYQQYLVDIAGWE